MTDPLFNRQHEKGGNLPRPHEFASLLPSYQAGLIKLRRNALNPIILFILFFVGCQSPVRRDDVDIPSAIPAKAKHSYPSDALILESPYLVIVYSKERNIAYYSEYVLKAEDLRKFPVKRRENFKSDPRLNNGPKAVKPYWYKKSGYDKGHLAPSADFLWNEEANESTFLMSNIAPQRPQLNRVAWRVLELKVRGWACGEGAVRVVTGPVIEENLELLQGYPLPIPRKFFKLVVDETPPKKAIGFIFSQDDKNPEDYKARIVSVKEVERQTKLQLLGNESTIAETSSLDQWKTGNCFQPRKK